MTINVNSSERHERRGPLSTLHTTDCRPCQHAATTEGAGKRGHFNAKFFIFCHTLIKAPISGLQFKHPADALAQRDTDPMRHLLSVKHWCWVGFRASRWLQKVLALNVTGQIIVAVVAAFLQQTSSLCYWWTWSVCSTRFLLNQQNYGAKHQKEVTCLPHCSFSDMFSCFTHSYISKYIQLLQNISYHVGFL